MSQETQPIRIETGEEVAFELMKFIAEKENSNSRRKKSAIIIWIYLSNALRQFMTGKEFADE